MTDAQIKDGKGNQVLKFSPDGKLLMSLGKAGVAGSGTGCLQRPCDVAIAQNGDIFVADGHIADVPVNGIMKFSKDGKFIKAWGKRGTGPGEFDTPHSIAIDSRGRIFVADRSNSRVQIFDQDGKFIDQWKQFGRPSGIYIDRNDTMVVADSQSNSKQNPGYTRGIRVGSAPRRQGDRVDSVRRTRPGEKQQCGRRGCRRLTPREMSMERRSALRC